MSQLRRVQCISLCFFPKVLYFGWNRIIEETDKNNGPSEFTAEIYTENYDLIDLVALTMCMLN